MNRPHKWATNAASVSPEKVKSWIEGAKGNKWWAPVFLVTDTDVFWVQRGFLTRKVHRIPRGNIASVSFEQGVMWDSINLNVTGGDLPDTSLRVNRMRRSESQRIVDLLQNTRASETGRGSTDVKEMSKLDELEKLASLKDKGIITEEEFSARKKELLS